MQPTFEQFIKERKFLKNVSPRTVEWYERSLRWLGTESPTEDDLKAFVMRMREKNLKATGCNCVIRAVNAYLKWAGSPLRVPKLKEPQLLLPTYTAEQVARIVKFKPKGFYQRRLHLLMLLLLDTGCRISEAIGLHVTDVDLDNLLLTLDGKGSKQRRVPFSLELRRHLFRYMGQFPAHALVFSTKRGCKLDRDIVRRDAKLLCERLGFKAPVRTLHATRHSFALNYLRKGGSVFHLQRVLGHSSLEMTRRYVSLTTDDLKAQHERVSLLS